MMKKTFFPSAFFSAVQQHGRTCLTIAAVAGSIVLSACSTPRITPTATFTRAGRIAIRIEQEPQAQSFIAGFELNGNVQAGSLLLYSPLGNVLGSAEWNEQQATLKRGEKVQTYASLEELLGALFHTPFPTEAFIDWLDGKNTAAQGWEVDLKQYAQGRIRAKRLHPAPQAQISVALQPAAPQ